MLLLDEIDTLIGDTLIAVLRQLRARYDRRPESFPQSVVLCGVRDVRDYRIQSSAENAAIAGGSAFNVRAESLRLGDFTEAEVRSLLDQHTRETGQAFTLEALETVWRQTRGQPWLVNALCRRACFDEPAGRDRSRAIAADDVYRAQEHLILSRQVHLDQLADKLQEDRVRRVVEPLLSGASEDESSTRDLEYVRDLGLIAKDDPPRIANPIYAEIVPRELTYPVQAKLIQDIAWYVDGDGGLDVDKLLGAFQAFFREHSEHWLGRFDYAEAGPQLILQAFLQRVVNDGGRIEREYGLGRGRTDLLVVWPRGGAPAPDTETDRFVIECKVAHRGLDRTIDEGVVQTAAYMDRCAARTGHLVVFDRRADRSWDEKIFRRTWTGTAGRSPSGGREYIQRQQCRHAHVWRIDYIEAARRSRRLTQNEARPLGPQHLVRRHTLDAESDARVRDFDPARGGRRNFVRDYGVAAGLRLGDEIIVGDLKERAHGRLRVRLAPHPAAHVCQCRNADASGRRKNPSSSFAAHPDSSSAIACSSSPTFSAAVDVAGTMFGDQPVPERRTEVEPVMQVLGPDEDIGVE